jgi:hypothetical protein
MGLYEARGNLSKSFKDLLTRWQYTKTLWDDPQAEALEKETLEPLEKNVRTAAEAMDQMKRS